MGHFGKLRRFCLIRPNLHFSQKITAKFLLFSTLYYYRACQKNPSNIRNSGFILGILLNSHSRFKFTYTKMSIFACTSNFWQVHPAFIKSCESVALSRDLMMFDHVTGCARRCKAAHIHDLGSGRSCFLYVESLFDFSP